MRLVHPGFGSFCRFLIASSVVIAGLDLQAEQNPLKGLVGYTELRTNLPGGRHANEVTMRAVIARADGSERRQIAPELSKEPGSWTQFAGFSPVGKTAVIGRGWRS
ncbi:MAG: hypothetical protein AB7O26_14320, partial [Planctomycetaceae bacterium]